MPIPPTVDVDEHTVGPHRASIPPLSQLWRNRRIRLVLGPVLVVLLIGALSVVWSSRRSEAGMTCDLGRTPAPGGSWCSLYTESFDRVAPLGTFVNRDPGDWFLSDANPYAGSIRSYPDGWGTTANLSLNLASATAEVLKSAEGADGVFSVHGHSKLVGGRVQALGGSFYPVIRPSEPPGDAQVSQTYGRYTVRFRTVGTAVPTAGDGAADSSAGGGARGGYGTAFLLWPADNRWSEGEIDYPEMAWGDRIGGYVHTIGNPQVNSAEFELQETTQTWNTATIEWSPNLLVFLLNGNEVFRTTTDVPSTPMRWGFQSGGMFATPAASQSGRLLVDRIDIQAFTSN